MNKDEILVPILTAINDLREEVRENRKAIVSLENRVKNLEDKVERLEHRVGRLEDRVGKLEDRVGRLEDRVGKLEKRMQKHEDESKKDRKAILDILYTYEKVTDNQYNENKTRIEKLEERFAIISA